MKFLMVIATVCLFSAGSSFAAEKALSADTSCKAFKATLLAADSDEAKVARLVPSQNYEKPNYLEYTATIGSFIFTVIDQPQLMPAAVNGMIESSNAKISASGQILRQGPTGLSLVSGGNQAMILCDR